MADESRKLHFDYTVSIPNVVSLILTIGSFIWWTATFSAETSAKFASDDKRLVAIESRQGNFDKISERLIVQETKMDALIDATRDMQNEFKEFRKSESSIRRAEIKAYTR